MEKAPVKKKKKRRKRKNEFNVPERATLQSPGTTQRFFFFSRKEKTYIACVVERHTTETFFQSGNFEVSNLREKAARLHHARSAITFFFPSSFFFFRFSLLKDRISMHIQSVNYFHVVQHTQVK